MTNAPVSASVPSGNMTAVKGQDRSARKDEDNFSGMDFMSVMMQHTSASVTVRGQTIVNTDVSKNASKVTENLKSSSQTKLQAKVTADSTQSVQSSTDSTHAVDDTRPEKFESDVRKALQDDLHVTDDEIDEAMGTLGLTFADLLNPENLTALASKLTGSESAAELLLNPGFTELLSDMQLIGVQAAAAGTDNSGIEIPDDMTEPDGTGSLDLTEGIKDSAAPDTVHQEAGDTPAASFQNSISENGSPIETVSGQAVPASGEAVRENADADSIGHAGEADPAVVTEAPEAEQQPAAEEHSADAEDGNNGEKDAFGTRDRSTASARQPVTDGTFSAPGTDPLPEQVTETVPEERPVSFTAQETREIIAQIATNVRAQNTGETHSLEMTLTPEHLGKLMMKVSSDGDGSVRARIQTENENVKNALEIRLTELRENLNTAGLRVNEIEISVAAKGFERQMEEDLPDFRENLAGGGNGGGQDAPAGDGRGQRRRNIDLNHLEDLHGLMTEEELLTAQIMHDEGNTVNFSA